jgi:hypothetical protein
MSGGSQFNSLLTSHVTATCVLLFSIATYSQKELHNTGFAKLIITLSSYKCFDSLVS